MRFKEPFFTAATILWFRNQPILISLYKMVESIAVEENTRCFLWCVESEGCSERNAWHGSFTVGR